MCISKHIIILHLLLYTDGINAQVGIGTTSVDPSAIIELQSNDKGFLPPRLSTEQRNEIPSPLPGLMIYNTTYHCLQYYIVGGWYDPCCKGTVESGISSFNFLAQVDPTAPDVFTKINSADGTSTGTTAANGEYVYSASSSSGASIALTYTPGSSESTESHDVFKYTTSSHPIDYKSISYLSRDRTAGYNPGGSATTLFHDFTGGDEISNMSFDIFLVGRMDSAFTPYPGNSSFFSTSTSASQTLSFQLGVGNALSNGQGVVCSRDYYNIRYTSPDGTAKVLCGYTEEQRMSSTDGRLHIFNIECKEDPVSGNKIFALYIDGLLADSDSTLTSYMEIDMLKLFANRKGNSGVQSDISELSIFSPALSTEEQETMNHYLLCKYGD